MLAMCFKKPKLPEKTEEDKQAEAELASAREARKRQLAYDLKSEKDAQTEASLARAMGFTGSRSLLTGPKGGAGYIGIGSGRVAGKPSAPKASVLPPRGAPASNIILSGGGSMISGGGGGGGSKSTSMIIY